MREVAITYSGQIVGSGIGFVIQLLLQRKLGSADYGLLGLAGSTGMLTSVLTDAGLSHAMVRFSSRHLAEGRADQAWRNFAGAFWIRMGIALVVAVVGFASAGLVATHVFHKPDLLGPLSWQFLGVPAATAYAWWGFFIQSWQRFRLRSVLQVVLALAKLAAFGVLWLLVPLMPTVAILLDMGANSAGFLLGLATSPKGLFQVPRQAWWESSRSELLPWCAYTGVMLTGDVLFNELDTFMLGVYCPEEVVGVYRCAWTYAMVLGFLNSSVSNVLFPKVTSISNPHELRTFLRTIVKLTTFLAVLTLPALPFLSWWIPYYDIKYAGAVPVFYVMYVGIVFELVVGPLNYALYALDRPQVLVLNAGMKILLNAAANVFLIPLYGAFGAASATIVTRLFGGAFILWILRSNLRKALASGDG